MERGLRIVTRAFTLLLPALIPSWRFFDVIAPSPRIEYRILKEKKDKSEKWVELRPRPYNVSLALMMKRMVWNPWWNENLFLASCAERLAQNATDHSVQEIVKRIRPEIEKSKEGGRLFQFRLIFMSRDGDDLRKDTAFISSVYDVYGKDSS